MTEQIQRYIQLSKMEKDIKKEMEELKPIVIEELWNDPMIVGDFKINKSVRRTPFIKEWFSVIDIMKECPEGIEQKPDFKWLEKNQAWHKFIDYNTTSFITVKKIWKE